MPIGGESVPATEADGYRSASVPVQIALVVSAAPPILPPHAMQLVGAVRDGSNRLGQAGLAQDGVPLGVSIQKMDRARRSTFGMLTIEFVVHYFQWNIDSNSNNGSRLP